MKLQIASLFLLSNLAHSKPRKLDGLRKAKKEKHIQHRHMAAESRIVGGDMTAPGEYPFFVDWNECGASLIHDDIILSAAHCNVIGNNNVLIGAFEKSTETDDAELRSIVARRPHPDYNDVSLGNDFLVMKLNQASTKPPISINSDPSFPSDSESLLVMGFGAISEGKSESDYLRDVDVIAISHDTCNAQYDGEIMEDVMFCAGVPEGGKDSCQGDSGGPIIDSRGVQVGVVSWGNGCALPEFAGVYSRVSGVAVWINEQICELSDNPPDFCSNGTPPAAGGALPVQMNLLLDMFPEDSGLVITSDTGNIVANYPPGSFSLPNILFTETVNLVPGNYQLEITDAKGDGLCCGNSGHSVFEVYALLPDGEEQLLVEGDGTFTYSKLVEFTVPSPTQSEQCQDQSGEFLVDAFIGDADCEWLGSNLGRYNHLCQFLDVAATCRNTCDACKYFE